ncbi:MAG: DUF5320 domain-containing protein [Candidatus Omnitrophica bacterium]|nr:DUF5320 domain-containing protein [Candidatus Omnitrophota bacterium]MDD5487879.1 DUF5320 domain-containing protein [Candidatus Omnitrophota bacterium]
MPGFDGTGPAGVGPMTGGGRGYCVMPSDRPVVAGGGMGIRGRGGRGRRNRYYATGLTGWQRAGYYGYPAGHVTAREEKGMLKAEAEALEAQLGDIRARIAELEKSDEQ